MSKVSALSPLTDPKKMGMGVLLGIKETDSATGCLRAIEHGLPVSSLERLSRQIAPTDRDFKYRFVPKATLSRRLKSKKLSCEESDHLARIAQVWEAALEVWQSADDARAFLKRPHPLLDGRAPLEVAMGTDLGARMVEDILGRLLHGTAA